jgi:hypothetical protein
MAIGQCQPAECDCARAQGPTKAGFKKPGEAYFEKNLLFDDLPTIALPNTKQIKGGMEKMLLAIGVRRTVDLQLVFSRYVIAATVVARG